MFDTLEDAFEAERAVFIGYDPMEDAAAKMLMQSIRSRTQDHGLIIVPIIRDELLVRDMLNRPLDPNGSTQFSITRFMVPNLMCYKGIGIFLDCDMLITRDIEEMFALFDETKAVQVVKHDYTPKTDSKMGGMVQTQYPRKNWSSAVIYNCGHPSNNALSQYEVETATPQYLHRFEWLTDDEIGELPKEFNWLAGEQDWYDAGNYNFSHELPFNIHHTLGNLLFCDNREFSYSKDEFSTYWADEFQRTFLRPFDPNRDEITLRRP